MFRQKRTFIRIALGSAAETRAIGARGVCLAAGDPHAARRFPVKKHSTPVFAAALCLLLLAGTAGAGLYRIDSVEVLDWPEHAPPYAAIPERLGEGASRRSRAWKQLVVRYAARRAAETADVQVYALCRLRDGRRIVLSGRRRNNWLHEPETMQCARFFAAPKTVKRIKKLEGVAVRILYKERVEARGVFPRAAANAVRDWEQYPMLDGLLLDALQSPWAHLKAGVDGGLEPRKEAGTEAGPSGPPAEFLKLIELYREEGGAE